MVGYKSKIRCRYIFTYLVKTRYIKTSANISKILYGAGLDQGHRIHRTFKDTTQVSEQWKKKMRKRKSIHEI